MSTTTWAEKTLELNKVTKMSEQRLTELAN
jgi:hypothetical protein